ncbi:MAG: FtsW/RodA/SpoVE family cell cycle protein [Alphaproteobacteria bacterium]
MSVSFSRADTSVIGRWWWTVDRWTLVAILLLIGAGAMLTLAASPPAAARIRLDSFHFVRQQMILLPLAFGLMLGISLLSLRSIKLLAVIVLAAGFVFTLYATFYGAEIKGARRWINLGGFSLQASEFLKPSFAVVAAWLFSLQRTRPGSRGAWIAAGLGGILILVLLKQPDLGMAAVVFATWFALFFMAGLPVIWIALFVALGAGGLFAAYKFLPHVTQRINLFLDPSSGDNYQVDMSLGAFMNGGLFGRGPGEGTVKAQLPDAHSDFVFAVAGEEFGLIACLLIVAVYLFIVLRGLSRVLAETNLFILYAATGLLVGFGLQAFINMASALHLVPTKGMTLPFISYGGSSLLALAIGMGMLLALTRKRYGPGVEQ